MTGTTPLGLPYPTGGDLASQIPDHIQALAEALDDYLGGLSAVAPVGWTNVTLTGWTGNGQYARRAGMVTIALEVTLGSFNPGDGIGVMPVGLRPARTVRAVGEFNGAIRPFLVNTSGLIAVAGSGTQSGGIYGSITYPV